MVRFTILMSSLAVSHEQSVPGHSSKSSWILQNKSVCFFFFFSFSPGCGAPPWL